MFIQESLHEMFSTFGPVHVELKQEQLDRARFVYLRILPIFRMEGVSGTILIYHDYIVYQVCLWQSHNYGDFYVSFVNV